MRLLNGATATVVAMWTLPGVGPLWDLSLDATHTFAVGDVQAVVHNCPVGGAGGGGGNDGPTIYEKNAQHIFRSANGHFSEDTPENRQFLTNMASNRQILWEQTLTETTCTLAWTPDGWQMWAYVRGTEIRNGGLNQPGATRQRNPLTGEFKA